MPRPSVSPMKPLWLFFVLFSVSQGALGSGFAPVVVYPAGNSPSSVLVGFFNQDSYADIAVTNRLDNTVSILFGNGDGTFQQPVNYSVGLAPSSIVGACEVLRGGPIVLAVANSGDNTVSVLIGNGDGTFQPAVNYGTGSGTRPQSVAWSDVNLDNNCDLLIANASGGTNNNGNIAILLGNGDGTFQPAVNYDTGGVQPQSVTSAPFEGGIVPDLAVANFASNNVSILLNDGSGNFTVSQIIAVSTAPIFVMPFYVSDLFVANSGSNSMTHLINVSGTFTHTKNFATGKMPVALTGGIFNQSHYLEDIAVANEGDQTVSAFIAKRFKPGFRRPVTLSTCTSPQYVVAADVNQDNLSDMILACSNGVGVMLNTGP